MHYRVVREVGDDLANLRLCDPVTLNWVLHPTSKNWDEVNCVKCRRASNIDRVYGNGEAIKRAIDKLGLKR